MPVGLCPDDLFGGDVASRAWLVIDNNLPAESFGKPLRHQARDDVHRTAGSVADQKPNRPAWIGLGRQLEGCSPYRTGGSRRQEGASSHDLSPEPEDETQRGATDF